MNTFLQQVCFSEMDRSDVPAVAEIERCVSSEPWSERLFLGEFSVPVASRFWLVAKTGETLIGYGGIMFAAEESHFLNLGVHIDYMRRGVGSVLVERLLLCASSLGFSNVVHLEVRETNKAAIALYKKFGFVQVGRRENYYAVGVHALLFSLQYL